MGYINENGVKIVHQKKGDHKCIYCHTLVVGPPQTHWIVESEKLHVVGSAHLSCIKENQ